MKERIVEGEGDRGKVNGVDEGERERMVGIDEGR